LEKPQTPVIGGGIPIDQYRHPNIFISDPFAEAGGKNKITGWKRPAFQTAVVFILFSNDVTPNKKIKHADPYCRPLP
jgi:hypothetical protein